MNHYELYNKLLDKFTSTIMNHSCISTSCIATLMRIWSKYFFCSYTTLHFHQSACRLRNHRRQYECWQEPTTTVDPKSEEEFRSRFNGKIMSWKGSIKKIPKNLCIMTSWWQKKWDDSWQLRSPIIYNGLWWWMVSFDLVFLAPETRHAAAKYCV